MRPLFFVIVILLLRIATSCEDNNQPTQENFIVNFTIDHYAINVLDLDRSVIFYQEVFGLDEIKNGTELSHIRWFRLGKTQELHIIEVKDVVKTIPKGVHLALAVDDFDRFRESLENKKIPYSDWPGASKEISVRPDGVRQLYFEDPDGYWIEVNDANAF